MHFPSCRDVCLSLCLSVAVIERTRDTKEAVRHDAFVCLEIKCSIRNLQKVDIMMYSHLLLFPPPCFSFSLFLPPIPSLLTLLSFQFLSPSLLSAFPPLLLPLLPLPLCFFSPLFPLHATIYLLFFTPLLSLIPPLLCAYPLLVPPPPAAARWFQGRE